MTCTYPCKSGPPHPPPPPSLWDPRNAFGVYRGVCHATSWVATNSKIQCRIELNDVMLYIYICIYIYIYIYVYNQILNVWGTLEISYCPIPLHIIVITVWAVSPNLCPTHTPTTRLMQLIPLELVLLVLTTPLKRLLIVIYIYLYIYIYIYISVT
jgi:hypothetical protein